VGHRHGMCESNTAALYKSNGKDTVYTLSGTAGERHGMCELTFSGARRQQACQRACGGGGGVEFVWRCLAGVREFQEEVLCITVPSTK
jgi:hypothetical protein